jgi:hypothetical protein
MIRGVTASPSFGRNHKIHNLRYCRRDRHAAHRGLFESRATKEALCQIRDAPPSVFGFLDRISHGLILNMFKSRMDPFSKTVKSYLNTFNLQFELTDPEPIHDFSHLLFFNRQLPAPFRGQAAKFAVPLLFRRSRFSGNPPSPDKPI